MSRKVLVELCSGTASLSLWAMGRRRPLTGYMGSKRADAATLTHMLDAGGPAEVHLVDAGPWGDVWATLKDGRLRADTIRVLRAWHTRGNLVQVWPTLIYPPPADPAERVAQYLCLQARSAGCIPIWWSPERSRWESPSGARVNVDPAHQRGDGGGSADTRGQGLCDARKRAKMGTGSAYPASSGAGAGSRRSGPLYKSGPSRGLVHIDTLADRIAVLDRLDWGGVHVYHMDVRQVDPVPAATVYLDPPYLHCPRYAALLPRAAVLDLAARWAEVARIVAVSEAEPLTLPGWHVRKLRKTGKPEWLTMSRPPFGEIAEQIALNI